MYIATYMNQAEIVEKLVLNGADVNIEAQLTGRALQRRSPIHLASMKGKYS